jgi:hypothetical protein
MIKRNEYLVMFKFKCLSCAGQLLYTRVTDKMHCAI